MNSQSIIRFNNLRYTFRFCCQILLISALCNLYSQACILILVCLENYLPAILFFIYCQSYSKSSLKGWLGGVVYQISFFLEGLDSMRTRSLLFAFIKRLQFNYKTYKFGINQYFYAYHLSSIIPLNSFIFICLYYQVLFISLTVCNKQYWII